MTPATATELTESQRSRRLGPLSLARELTALTSHGLLALREFAVVSSRVRLSVGEALDLLLETGDPARATRQVAGATFKDSHQARGDLPWWAG